MVKNKNKLDFGDKLMIFVAFLMCGLAFVMVVYNLTDILRTNILCSELCEDNYDSTLKSWTEIDCICVKKVEQFNNETEDSYAYKYYEVRK